jgi:hypothetical protein
MSTQPHARRRKEEVENTARAWGEKLLALAEEAYGDSLQRDTDSVLGMHLDDLSRALTAYAARLGVEPVAMPAEPKTAGPEAQEPEAQETGLNQAETQEPLAPQLGEGAAVPEAVADSAFNPSDLYALLGALHERVTALETKPDADLPGWLRETLQSHHERMDGHDARIAQLEALLADALTRIAWLENNIGLSGVSVTDDFVADVPINPDDYNPESWGSIERAREALGKQVRREHRNLAGIRQTVLNAVVDLSDRQALGDLSDDDRAQLAQHRARADRLDQIDSVRDMKLDEIAGLDDLGAAKTYRADVGWPQ